MDIKLTAEEKTMLRAIYTNHDTVADMVDFIGKNTVYVMDILDKMEIWGIVERYGQNYIEWLRFKLTAKGKDLLPEMSEQEKSLAENYGIALEDYKVLQEIKKVGNDNNSFILSDNTGISTMKIVTIADNLEKQGYAKMGGLWRRYIAITSKGEEVLKKVG